LLVAIVGGSGSGKSWLASRLEKSLSGRAGRISLDDFYRDRSHLSPGQRIRINFDNPGAIDWAEFKKVLASLAKGRSVRNPAYDFTTHSRRSHWRILKPKEVMLVEGLWLLRSPSLRRYFDLKIFLECCQSTRLRRRLDRDLKSRGRTRASVLQQFRTTVQPMHQKFIESQKKWADMVLPESFSGREASLLSRNIQQIQRRPDFGVRAFEQS